MAEQRSSNRGTKPSEIRKIRRLATQNTPVAVIALKLEFTEAKVRAIAARHHIALSGRPQQPATDHAQENDGDHRHDDGDDHQASGARET